jgi:hypothetical protein
MISLSLAQWAQFRDATMKEEKELRQGILFLQGWQ